MPFSSTYLVVEPMRPVAEDLAMSLSDRDPDAHVLIAATEAEAIERIADAQAVILAIVHAAPSAFRASTLGSALAARGAICVLIGDRAEDESQVIEIPVLQRPYAPEAVQALLARLLDPPGLVPGE